MGSSFLVGMLRGFAGFADAAALPGFDELLEAEGDDEADCEGDDVDEDGIGSYKVSRAFLYIGPSVDARDWVYSI